MNTEQENRARLILQSRQEMTMPYFLDVALYMAQVAMMRYRALRAAGFDAGDAIRLCRQPIEL